MIAIAVFDSGFGGYFTTKAIERLASEQAIGNNQPIDICHLADSQNAPYGIRPPSEVAKLTTYPVLKALDTGYDTVFIACNTASTQYDFVHQKVEEHYPGRGKDIIPIIDISVSAVIQTLGRFLEHSNRANFALLATPLTIKLGTYPKALAKAYGSTLIEHHLCEGSSGIYGISVIALSESKSISIYQLAPFEWVGMVENGSTTDQKERIIQRDLQLLRNILPHNIQFDAIGTFCTHYPVFQDLITDILLHSACSHETTTYIDQSRLMASLFYERALEDKLLVSPPGTQKIQDIRTNVITSSHNTAVISDLAALTFPEEPLPNIITDPTFFLNLAQ